MEKECEGQQLKDGSTGEDLLDIKVPPFCFFMKYLSLCLFLSLTLASAALESRCFFFVSF